MIEETPSLNNEIINPNEILEKITDDVKKKCCEAFIRNRIWI